MITLNFIFRRPQFETWNESSTTCAGNQKTFKPSGIHYQIFVPNPTNCVWKTNAKIDAVFKSRTNVCDLFVELSQVEFVYKRKSKQARNLLQWKYHFISTHCIQSGSHDFCGKISIFEEIHEQDLSVKTH